MEKLCPNAVLLFFARYIGYGVALLMILVFLVLPSLVFYKENWRFIGKFFTVVFFIGMGYAVVAFIVARLSWECWKYELGEDSVKIEKGIIWKQYISIPYERIQNIEIYRGVLARMFELSDLRIETAGYSGRMMSEGRLPGLSRKKAEELREELVQRIKNQSRR